MAPSKQKKKKKGVGIDFKKVKHKVGRKLPPPQNATKVEFKAKSIVLPGQSVAQDKDGLAVNRRHKTLAELFTQANHYSERVRKDALIGMRDLFLLHPKELEIHFVTVLQKLSARFTDVDKAVRHSLLVLFRTVFSSVPEIAMKPLIPMVMAHLASATTHLTMRIRLDAFSFLDLLLQHYPSLLVPSFSNQIMEDYEHVLGECQVDAAVMLTVLESLTHFLSTLQAPHQKFNSQCTLRHVWLQKYDASKTLKGGCSEMEALHSYKCGVPGTSSASLECKASLPSALINVLLNCWTQCTPCVCSSPSPDVPALDCMINIATCICSIFEWLEGSYTALTNSSVRHKLRDAFLSSFSARFMAPFPISAPSAQIPPKVEEGLCAVNAGICKVMLHFFVPVNLKCDNFAVDRLLQYYKIALSGQVLPSATIHFKVAEPHVLSLISYAPCIIDCVEHDWRRRILQAIADTFGNCGIRSPLKLACVTSMSKILLTEPDEHVSKTWLQALPKFLWELKHEFPSSSKVILEILLHLAKSAPIGSSLAQEFSRLQAAMMPFFCTFAPIREGQVKCYYGPFLKLTTDCQELAVDLLYYFTDFQVPFLNALAKCSLSPAADIRIVIRLLEVLQAAFQRGRISLTPYLNFIITMLTGDPQVELDKNRSIVVGLLCHSLARIGDGDVVLELLSKPLSEDLEHTQTLCILLRVVAALWSSSTNLPRELRDIMPQKTAQLLISQIQEKDRRAALTLKYTMPLIRRNREFASLLYLALASDSSCKDAVLQIAAELVQHGGVDPSDVHDLVRNLSTGDASAEPKELL